MVKMYYKGKGSPIEVGKDKVEEMKGKGWKPAPVKKQVKENTDA